MKLVDCIWEIENIGKRTCEIVYENRDVFDASILNNSIENFEYVVVKVPMNHPKINVGLSEMGFVMIETQLSISKRFLEFNFEDRLIKHLYPHVSDQVVSTKEGLDEIIDKMTPDMFSTDRIYLDSHFSHDSSCKRYANWMKTEFYNKSGIIKKIFIDDKEIGFGMTREKGGVTYGLLGGIYESEQSEGYGLLTACSGFITAKKNNCPFKKVFTAISSNNVPMLQIYNYLNFKIDNMTYVFVKHQ